MTKYAGVEVGFGRWENLGLGVVVRTRITQETNSCELMIFHYTQAVINKTLPDYHIHKFHCTSIDRYLNVVHHCKLYHSTANYATSE